MITGIDLSQLSETDRQYYDEIKQQMQSAGSILECSFEMKFLDLNQCHLVMKTNKDILIWEQITIDGILYILDALVLQHQGKPLNIDQIEVIQDARQIEI